MYSRITTIVNPTGIHARPASDFMRMAAKFKSVITIGSTSKDTRANAKSIIFLLGLSLSKGTEVEVIADGVDEKEAVDALVELIQSGFGEL
jgi:phosphocarrier protein HPr